MKYNIFVWTPLLIFIIVILIIKRYFKKENIIMIEKISAVMLVLAYCYKSVSMGIISLMVMIIFHVLFINPIEGFDITQISDIIDNSPPPKKTIPKRIIQLWKTWSDKKPEMFSLYMESIKNMNPTYEYMFFKDEQIDEFLKTNYPHYYETYNKLPMNIQKVDFCRYVILYHFGGFYFDLDINALEPLDELLNHECVFPIDEFIHKDMCSAKRFTNFCNNKIEFLLGQYGFGCCPKNKFIKLLVDGIHQNVDNYIKSYVANSEEYVYSTTGPDFVTNLYTNYPDKKSIDILYYDKRQYFGKYAKHNFVGTWKTP